MGFNRLLAPSYLIMICLLLLMCVSVVDADPPTLEQAQETLVGYGVVPAPGAEHLPLLHAMWDHYRVDARTRRADHVVVLWQFLTVVCGCACAHCHGLFTAEQVRHVTAQNLSLNSLLEWHHRTGCQHYSNRTCDTPEHLIGNIMGQAGCLLNGVRMTVAWLIQELQHVIPAHGQRIETTQHICHQMLHFALTMAAGTARLDEQGSPLSTKGGKMQWGPLRQA